MKIRWLLVLTAALVVALVLAIPIMAQTSYIPGAQAEDQSSIRGYLTQKRDGTILVEEKPCRRDGRVVKYTRCDFNEWRGEKGSFAVTKRTKILDKSGEPTRSATYRDLKVGQTVKATYRGPMLPSYPSEGRARSVFILADVGRPAGG
jgi:hypothetical protein